MFQGLIQKSILHLEVSPLRLLLVPQLLRLSWLMMAFPVLRDNDQIFYRMPLN